MRTDEGNENGRGVVITLPTRRLRAGFAILATQQNHLGAYQFLTVTSMQVKTTEESWYVEIKNRFITQPFSVL